MSHTWIETTHKKFRDTVKVKRTFRNQGTLEELPSRESLHKVSRHSWDEDACVTLYNKLEQFLVAHVGHAANAVYSEFLHIFCTGLSDRWVDEAKRIYKNWFVSDVERTQHSPWRRDFYVDAFGVLQMRTCENHHSDVRSRISLVPVPKSDWSHASLPEAWERRNGLWFRLSFNPGSSFLPSDDSAFSRTGRDREFVNVYAAHRRSCSRKEIQQEIIPEIQRRNLQHLLD